MPKYGPWNYFAIVTRAERQGRIALDFNSRQDAERFKININRWDKRQQQRRIYTSISLEIEPNPAVNPKGHVDGHWMVVLTNKIIHGARFVDPDTGEVIEDFEEKISQPIAATPDFELE